jgi:hypothetical protein
MNTAVDTNDSVPSIGFGEGPTTTTLRRFHHMFVEVWEDGWYPDFQRVTVIAPTAQMLPAPAKRFMLAFAPVDAASTLRHGVASSPGDSSGRWSVDAGQRLRAQYTGVVV